MSSGGRWCRRASDRSWSTSRNIRRARRGCWSARWSTSSRRGRSPSAAPPCCCRSCAEAGRCPSTARMCSNTSTSTAPRRGEAPGRGPPPRSAAASATTAPLARLPPTTLAHTRSTRLAKATNKPNGKDINMRRSCCRRRVDVACVAADRAPAQGPRPYGRAEFRADLPRRRARVDPQLTGRALSSGRAETRTARAVLASTRAWAVCSVG